MKDPEFKKMTDNIILILKNLKTLGMLEIANLNGSPRLATTFISYKTYIHE